MGSGGVPSGGVAVSYARKLDKLGKPNSRADRYKNGEKVQSRWYDAKGRALRDRDYKHQGVDTHNFPHDHNWIWNGDIGIRAKNALAPDYIHFK